MKKILAALALLALVFGGVFAQELSISGKIELDADAFTTTSVKTSDKEAAYGTEVNGRPWEVAGTTLTVGSNRTDPEAVWAMFDGTDWSNTVITFKVAADNYGGTFEIGAPPLAGFNADGTRATTTSWLRKVEIWLQPASFLRLNVANSDGRSAWRAVNRLISVADMDTLCKNPPQDYHGTQVVSNTWIDQFTNGLKLDFLLDSLVEGLKIEGLVGTNQPVWNGTGWIGREEVTKGTYVFVVPSGASYSDANDLWTDITANASYVTSEDYSLPAGLNVTALSGGEKILLTLNSQLNTANGYSDAELYGRYAPNYALRVTFPLADIANFYAIYRLGVYGYTGNSTTGKEMERTTGDFVDADEVKGFDVGKNHLALFADLSPLFGAMDMPLNLVLGYTGYFESGWKVNGLTQLANPTGASASTYTEWTDGKAPFVSGIDLRLSYKINDDFGVSLHNNATFYTMEYDNARIGGVDLNANHVGFGKYANFTGKSATATKTTYAENLQDNYTYFRMFNQLGVQYQLVPDFFALNLQLSNEYQSFGTTAYFDEAKRNAAVDGLTPGSVEYANARADVKAEKGDPLYSNTFKAFLNGILTISEHAQFSIGLRLDINTDGTDTSKKYQLLPGFPGGTPEAQAVYDTEMNKEKSKVYTTTTTTFSVPVSFIVTF